MPLSDRDPEPPAKTGGPPTTIAFPTQVQRPTEAEAIGPEPVAPPEAGAPLVPVGPDGPALDPDVERAQGPASLPVRQTASPPPGGALDPVKGPLPGAREGPGQPALSPSLGEPQPGTRFLFAPEAIPLGKQSLGLTVDVQSPQFLNINQEATFKVVVKNNGQSDALEVVVRDDLPAGLEFRSSEPKCQQADSLLSWNLHTMSAGSEQTIFVRVKPVRVGSFDHAATVTAVTGGKSRTIVREPKLKVEATASPAKVLKGQTVEFKIRVSNSGDGPARSVLVRAKLSAGLRHESGEPNDQNLFEQTLDRLEAGQHIDLDPLVADTTLGGEQSCAVEVQSTDVVQASNPDDMRVAQRVQVVEPKLAMSVSGPDQRYTDTEATYLITVENPGTAAARRIRVRATLPLSGRLVGPLGNGQYDSNSRVLAWSVPSLEPGQKQTLSFRVRLGGVGVYRVTTEARGDGSLLATGDVRTDVKGMADLEFDVTERRRVVDVGEMTTFQIKIANLGTKEATGILITGVYTDNIEPVDASIDGNQQAKFNPPQHLVVFPKIERLAKGEEQVLQLRVRATKAGTAKCRFSLLHDDLKEQQDGLEDMAAFRVTEPRRQ